MNSSHIKSAVVFANYATVEFTKDTDWRFNSFKEIAGNYSASQNINLPIDDFYWNIWGLVSSWNREIRGH
jgi:hypothetical protein